MCLFCAFDRNNISKPHATTLHFTTIFKASGNLETIHHKLNMQEKARNAAKDKREKKRKRGQQERGSGDEEEASGDEEEDATYL